MRQVAVKESTHQMSKVKRERERETVRDTGPKWVREKRERERERKKERAKSQPEGKFDMSASSLSQAHLR